MARKKEFKIDKDDIAYEEEVEECCFSDYIPTDGNSIQLFSFEDDLDTESKSINNNSNSLLETTEEVNKKIESSSDNKTNNKNLKNSTLSSNTLLFDNRKTPVANGATPPINGEPSNIKRSYTLRKSTVRKINEIKSIHPDINVCVSTIVDIAIEYYHEHIINNVQ